MAPFRGVWSTVPVRSRRTATPAPAPRGGGDEDRAPGAGGLAEAVGGLNIGGGGERRLDKYDIPVMVSGEAAPPPADGFLAAGLAEAVLRNVARCGYESPSPVQRYAMPNVMAGRDLLAFAKKGRGKTAAFCLPVVIGLAAAGVAGWYGSGDRGSFERRAKLLVLAPTRELATQINEEANMFSFQTGRRAAIAYGGTPMYDQLRAQERGVDLVATPGRLLECMVERSKICLGVIKCPVMDEADRMLDMRFESQMRKIVDMMNMPRKSVRQAMLFSADFPLIRQLRELERGIDLVATPGRLLECMVEQSKICLGVMKYLLMDEADRMLYMGFEPQIRKIVDMMNMPKTSARQIMLFSATSPLLRQNADEGGKLFKWIVSEVEPWLKQDEPQSWGKQRIVSLLIRWNTMKESHKLMWIGVLISHTLNWTFPAVCSAITSLGGSVKDFVLEMRSSEKTSDAAQVSGDNAQDQKNEIARLRRLLQEKDDEILLLNASQVSGDNAQDQKNEIAELRRLLQEKDDEILLLNALLSGHLCQVGEVWARAFSKYVLREYASSLDPAEVFVCRELF